MGVSVVRFQADGFLILADRLLYLAFLVEGFAEGLVGLREPGLNLHHFLKVGNRLIELPTLTKHHR